MDINSLVKISARAWSLTILARMHQGTPGRQAALMAQTGASRTAFAASLLHLVELGVLERNPGHGHPMRPEYRLTPQGIEAAAMADKIERLTPQSVETTLLRRTWTLPVLAASQTPRYFTQIKGALGPITDRALSTSLKQLQSAKWLDRRVDLAASPPRSLYCAVGAGLGISKAANGT